MTIAPTRREPWRPQLHYSPAANWMNDPNGLVYFDGEYHLFYQYNPHGDLWGDMSWGHAVSRDLVDWTELPVALMADDESMFFSGSIVVDADNTAGFAAPGETALVAIFTHVQRDVQRQTQHLAWSVDRGRTWQRHAGNPVLDLGLRDFRDPKVFWHAPTARWIMLVSLPDRHRLGFYASTDLKRWQHLSDFGPAGAVQGIWECPDLFEVSIAGEPGRSAWVLKVDVFEGHVGGGSGAQYFVGHFDGRTFTATPRPDAPAQPPAPARWLDHGADFYAAVAWTDLPAGQPGPLLIGWMSDHHYAAQVPTAPWRGAMSLPRVLTLRREPDGLVLLQQPLAALDGLRREHVALEPCSLRDAARELQLPWQDGRALDLVLRLGRIDAREAGLRLRMGDGEQVVVGIERTSGCVFVDRSRAGRAPDWPAFASRRRAPLASAGAGAVRLRVVLDWGSVEVFAGDGEAAITEQVFPSDASRGVQVYADAGTAAVESLDVWRLDAATFSSPE